MEESASNYSRLTELNEEKENAEMALLEKMERWEYLEDLAAQIENQYRRIKRYAGKISNHRNGCRNPDRNRSRHILE